MAGSINDFKSSFTADLARPSRFDVVITPPLSMWANSAARKLTYRCETSQLPGRSLATTERKTYGPIEKLPYVTTYGDIDLTFIVDDDMSQKKFFDAWMEKVNPSFTHNFGFKDEYSSSIVINQYDVSGEISYSVELIDAYPISVNQLDLDWSSDGHHKLVVTFAYTRWQNSFLSIV
jgi:hypothetical protein